MTASAAAGVVIIGGGIAGGLLALALRDQGQPVTLIDAPGPPGVDGATGLYRAGPWPPRPWPGWRRERPASGAACRSGMGSWAGGPPACGSAAG